MFWVQIVFALDESSLYYQNPSINTTDFKYKNWNKLQQNKDDIKDNSDFDETVIYKVSLIFFFTSLNLWKL